LATAVPFTNTDVVGSLNTCGSRATVARAERVRRRPTSDLVPEARTGASETVSGRDASDPEMHHGI
jgi:hypothetical protein